MVAAGCLAERFGEALTQDIPELDGVLGTRRWFEIDRLVQEIERGGRPCWHGAEPVADPTFTRQAGGPTAYVKIAEGCNMSCTFCAIPGFKGAQRSKSPAAIVSEIRDLVAAGVREVILVSQNTTAYGLDCCGTSRLAPVRRPSTPRLSLRLCLAPHLTGSGPRWPGCWRRSAPRCPICRGCASTTATRGGWTTTCCRRWPVCPRW